MVHTMHPSGPQAHWQFIARDASLCPCAAWLLCSRGIKFLPIWVA